MGGSLFRLVVLVHAHFLVSGIGTVIARHFAQRFVAIDVRLDGDFVLFAIGQAAFLADKGAILAAVKRDQMVRNGLVAADDERPFHHGDRRDDGACLNKPNGGNGQNGNDHAHGLLPFERPGTRNTIRDGHHAARGVKDR